MPLRHLWAGCPCRSADRSPLRHAGMSLRDLWAGWPWRRPSRSHLRHARMPLRGLWARSPCRRTVRRTLRHDWMPLEHLCAYSPCRRPGPELDPNLSVHEKGSNHGQTRLESPNPRLDSTIFIILAKIGRFDESAISGVRSLQPEGIPPETVARCIGLPVEEVKALHEKV